MPGLIATTTATLLRGGENDAMGDFVPTDTPVAGASSVPCSMVERSRSVFDPASSAWRVVRYLKARFIAGAFPAVVGDRVRDESTGLVYVVSDVKPTARALGGSAAFAVELVDVNNGGGA
jgi:hypothetical protein